MIFFRNKTGFTLVELVVSAGIIIIIFSYTLANFRGAERNDMALAIQKLTSDIREVETIALAGKVYSEVIPNIYPAGGYGITFEKASADYRLYADLDSNVYPDDADDEVAPVFLRSMLGNNLVNKIYYSEELSPSDPTGTSPAFADDDWIEIDFVSMSFNLSTGKIKIVDLPASDPEDSATFIGLLITNPTLSKQGYLYISKNTGLISGGVIN